MIIYEVYLCEQVYEHASASDLNGVIGIYLVNDTRDHMSL
jgi:hypothetical protein